MSSFSGGSPTPTPTATVILTTESYLETLLIEASTCGSLSALLAFDSKLREKRSIGTTTSTSGPSITLNDIGALIFNPAYYQNTWTKLSQIRPDLKDELNYAYQSIMRYLLWNLRFSIQRAPQTQESATANSSIMRSPMGNIPTRCSTTTGKSLSARDQAEFFENLHEIITCSNPDHIMFPGENPSYVELSGIYMSSIDAYSITIWLKLDANSKPGAYLCRCRSPVGGLEIMLVSRDANHVWTVAVRSRFESDRGLAQGEALFNFKITPDKWHLFGVTHSVREVPASRDARRATSDSEDRYFISVSLDGVPQDNPKDSPQGKELRFPFMHSNSREFHWWFGIDLKGLMSSISLYNGYLDRNMLTLQFEQGPNYHNLHQSFRTPQCTADSGLFTQGSVLAKGKFAEKASKASLIFSITPDSFRTSASNPSPSSPQRYPAILHVDVSEMGAIYSDTERNVNPVTTGRCSIVRDFNLQHRLPCLGGIVCWIYLLWLYCEKANHAANGEMLPNGGNGGGSGMNTGRVRSSSEDGNGLIDSIGRIQDCLSTIYLLLKTSGEAREEFIQLHGFHMIRYCLSALKDKERTINESIAQSCVDIVDCFGIDSRNWDGIASALQGLLINFKLWGQCKTSVLKVVLDAIYAIGERDKVKILHKACGYQHVIDSVRTYLLTPSENMVVLASGTPFLSPPIPPQANPSLSPPPLIFAPISSPILPSWPTISISASQSSYSAISKVIKSTLDSSKSNCVGATPMHELNSVQLSYIAAMIDYMLSCIEEDCNPLLVEDLLFYICNVMLKDHPSLLLQKLVKRRFCDTTVPILISRPQSTTATKRYAVHLMVRAINRDYRQHIVNLHSCWESLKTESKQTNATTQAQAKRFYEVSAQYNETSNHLLKAWQLMSIVASFIQRNAKSDEKSYDGYIEGLVASVDEHDVIDNDLEENIESVAERSNIWFVLPFLDSILSRCSLDVYRKCIIDMNISLKTESISLEIIMACPAHMYVNVFLNMALCQVRGGMNNQSIDTILDSLVYIIDCRIKAKPEEAWFTLLQLEYFISRKCVGAKEKSHVLFSKILALYLQYISKTNNRLTYQLLQNLNHFLVLANNRGYCGNLVHIQNVEQNTNNNLLDLQDFDDDILLFNSTIEGESQSCISILEILQFFRKAKQMSKDNIVFAEFDVISLAWLTILSRMNELSEGAIDRVFTEINHSLEYYVQYTTKLNNYEDHVFNFFCILFTLLKSSLATAPTSDRRDRYHALVYSLCHRIFDLKSYFERNGHNISNYIVGDNPTTSQMASVYEFIGSKFFININLIYKKLADMKQFQEHTFEHSSSSSSSSESVAAGGGGGTGGILSTAHSSPSPLRVSGNEDLKSDLVNFGISEAEPTSTSILPLPRSTSDVALDEWWRVRRNLTLHRAEVERVRLSRFVNTNDLAARAMGKYFKKKCHKLELEVFEDKYDCHWKLAVSNEGQPPGRRRVALRPHVKYADIPKKVGKELGGENLDQNELGKALAKVVQKEDGNLLDTAEGVTTDVLDGDSSDVIKSTPNKGQFMGESWGIVDNDGTEEGFDVIGQSTVDQDSNNNSNSSSNINSSSGGGGAGTSMSHSTSSSSTSSGGAGGVGGGGGGSEDSSFMIPNSHDDMLGDMFRSHQASKEGRYNDCGPSIPGSKRNANLKDVISSRAILVTASGNVWGTIAFNEKEIYFLSSLDAGDGHMNDHASVAVSKHRYMRRRKWMIVHISHVYLRRYRLRDTAIEIFFRKGKHKSLFVDFGHTKDNEKTRMTFAKLIMDRTRNAIKQSLNNTVSYTQLISKHTPSDSSDFNIQEQWLNGHMSNFDYLMAVNTIAGRSFNDLCQYPVMPWVIQQYTEPAIDLSDPATFRDLSKPMGALNPTRLEDFVSRYANFSDNVSNEIPAFMYGSHYSTMVGVVLYYLVRLQPFAALHKEMQSGNFDVPDRLFASVPRTFLHNTTQLSEVKELTPEWFTCPDMFRNVNNFDFGETQDGSDVSEVELPPWAKTPEEFVRINREALESDFVSENLHHWIDLIFGYKQSGPAAVAANNVFYYLTYYGKIDRSSLDENLRMATELQIAHFGQMPIQIFKKPHPARRPRMYWKYPRQIWNFNNTFISRIDVNNLRQMTASDEEKICLDASSMLFRPGSQACLPFAVFATSHRIMVFQENGAVETFKFGLSDFSKQILITLAAENKKRVKTAAKKVSNTSSASKVTPTTATSQNNLIDLGDYGNDPDSAIISFDDDFSGGSGGGVDGGRGSGSLGRLPSADSSGDRSPAVGVDMGIGSSGGGSGVWAGIGQAIFPSTESLLFLERDSNTRNPDLQPNRIPITLNSVDDSDTMFNRVFASCFGNTLLVSGGFSSGRVAVREIDPLSGFIETAGDFFGHSCRVVALASDKMPNTTTEMILSADESGVLLLWSITKYQSADKGVYGLSRRPVKRFVLWPSAQIDCDLCCSLNVGVVLLESRVVVVSLERDEKNSEFAIGESRDLLSGGDEELYGAKIAICDDGFIAVNLRSHNTRSVGAIRVYTMSGRLCATIENVIVSFFSCPSQSNILLCGLQDGSIVVYNFCDLKVLLSFNPHKECVPVAVPSLSSSSSSSAAKSKADERRELYSHDHEPTGLRISSHGQSFSVPVASVVWVSIAPEPNYSGLILAVNSNGDLFLRALPDFVAWDKMRIPTTLSQLVSVPVQAVKSTIQTATNILVTGVESTVSVLGSAKNLADDAISEAKRRGSMAFKSFGSLLGLGGGGGGSSSK